MLSPSFFASVPASSLAEVFQSLRRVNLTFRLSHAERANVGDDLEICYGDILQQKLSATLSTATELEHLMVNFEDYHLFGPVIYAGHILGECVWPKLKSLDLNYVFFHEKHISDSLKRQPSLESLELAFAVLATGNWSSLLKSMSKLGLKSFTPSGVFEDSDATYIMDYIDADAWEDEKLEITMVSQPLLPT